MPERLVKKTTADALPLLRAARRIPFRELFAGHPNDLYTNKGNVGQMLERYIGLQLGNALVDFTDGELKSNKTAPNGKPLETIAITQIKGIIDTLIAEPRTPFAESTVRRKINHMLIVPVVKEPAQETGKWYILDVVRVETALDSSLYRQLETDYNTICEQLRTHVETSPGGFIHTSNGYYLQVRSKDSVPYRPIESAAYGRAVSNKNHAFYFQKRFMEDAVAGKFK